MNRRETDAQRDERERLRILKLQLLSAHPFWGHVLVQLELIEAPDLPSFAATDCVKRIWFNPALTRQLTMKQLGFVLAHEVGHIVLLSEERRKGRDPARWNRATDYAINRMVSVMQHPGRPGSPLYDVPRGTFEGLGTIDVLLDDRFAGLVAEAIYERLAEEEAAAEQSLDLGFGPVRVRDHGGGIDLHVPSEMDAEARGELRELLSSAVRGWEADGRRGLAPGSQVRQLHATPRVRVRWLEVLSALLEEHAAGLDQYDPRRPHRRWLDHEVIVPSLRGAEPPPVVVALDTSGSMTRPVLAAVFAELRALSERVPDVTLIVADARVQEVVPAIRLAPYLDRGRVRGGGGTDHRPVFEYIRRKLPRPALFVGLTDLFSRFPDDPPDYPVLWVVPPNHGRVPFGRVLVTGDH